jgi:hypothetical protein
MPDLDEVLTELLNKSSSISDEDKIKYMNEFDDKTIEEKENIINKIKNTLVQEEESRKLELENVHNKRGM